MSTRPTHESVSRFAGGSLPRLGGIFGGGSTTPFGSSSGNVLTKITGVLGVIFIVSSLGMAYMARTIEDDDVLGEARRSNTTEQSESWFENSAHGTLPGRGSKSGRNGTFSSCAANVYTVRGHS